MSIKPCQRTYTFRFLTQAAALFFVVVPFSWSIGHSQQSTGVDFASIVHNQGRGNALKVFRHELE